MFTADILDEQYQRDMMFISKGTANGMDAIYIAEIIFASEFEQSNGICAGWKLQTRSRSPDKKREHRRHNAKQLGAKTKSKTND